MSVSKPRRAARKKVDRKKPEQNVVVMNHGVKCPHCDCRHGHKVTNTYPNGRRRKLCGSCGRPFVDMLAV
jgi:transposase-like protein